MAHLGCHKAFAYIILKTETDTTCLVGDTSDRHSHELRQRMRQLDFGKEVTAYKITITSCDNLMIDMNDDRTWESSILHNSLHHFEHAFNVVFEFLEFTLSQAL